MKIIDAHLHLFPESKAWAEEMARNVGHHNSTEHLRQVYRELGIVHGVVMGNHSLKTGEAPVPEICSTTVWAWMAHCWTRRDSRRRILRSRWRCI